jgi:hypothetical protein
MSGKMHGAGDAIMLVPEIIDNGALLVLSLKGNRLATKEAGKALAAALAGNSVLKELDLSSNFNLDTSHSAEFAQELAVGIRDNGALIKLDISSNHIRDEQDGDLRRICVASGIELARY